MKKKISHKVRLGIFISLGILIFILAIYFIGEKQQLFRSTFRLSGVFKDVAGLQVGNNVRLSGINVGTIDNITIISDTSVRVIILVDENTRQFIKKDAVASIGSEGLMGNKVLVISPGTGGKKSIENDDVIATSQPTDIDEIMKSLKTTIDNTAYITGDLAKIATNIESGKGTIGRLMMDKTWRQDIESTIINLKDGSVGFKTFMDKTNQLDSILIRLNKTIDNTSSITYDLSKITDNIQSGEGMIGKLLMDQSMGQNLDSTLINLKNGLAEFELFMKKAQDSWLLGL
ncbi:MAG TPA: MlaD family protein [Ignavibacteriaceae bacterium]|jgi:phospholipid/cholesterol/gamma-HCH transport system substrate-binding protein